MTCHDDHRPVRLRYDAVEPYHARQQTGMKPQTHQNIGSAFVLAGAASLPSTSSHSHGNEASVTAAPRGVADDVSRRIVWLVLILATVIAAVLRFPFLDHQSLWLDEVFTREILREATLSGVWHHIQRTESTPPLYYLVGWLVGAHSAAAMRAIPALSLTAAVPIGYLAFRRLTGQRPALATAMIIAVSPMLVLYSTDARSYGLLVLTGLMTIWGFAAVLESPSSVRYALWALACVACIWTHYFGGFLVIAEVGVLLWSRQGQRIATLAWSLTIMALVAPLVPLVTAQASSERAAFIEAEPLTSRVVTTVRQFAMGPNVPRTWLEGAGLAIWCLAVSFGVLIVWRRGRKARICLILVATTVGLPLLMSVTKVEDRFYARNVMAAVPMAIAIAAPALLRLRAVPLACYLMLAVATSIWVATNWRYEQADWRDAVSRIEAYEPRAPVIAITENSIPVVSTYLRRRPSPVGLETKNAWLAIEPLRGAHDRSLVLGPLVTIPGFHPVRELRLHAFRLILIEAASPTRVVSGVVPHAAVFSGRGR